MKNLKIYLAFVLLNVSFYSNFTYAYVFSFTNGTTSSISVDICGIAKVGCSMMQGDGHSYEKEIYGKTICVSKAGHLRGPQAIEPQQTLELNFNGLDGGICANLSEIKVGINGNGIVSRQVIALKNQYYDQLFNSIDSFGGDVDKMGDSLSNFLGDAGTVVKVGTGLGSLLGSIGQLVRSSTCKDMSFLVLNDKNNLNEVYIVTRDL